jgi:hypothetical protein
MNGKKIRFFDLAVGVYGMNYRISSLINLKSLSDPAGHNLNPPGYRTAGHAGFGSPAASIPIKKNLEKIRCWS